MENEKLFGMFTGGSSEEQLQLTDFDKEIINEMRLPFTKLCFAVQLGTVRFLGTFFTDFSKIPLEVIVYLFNQLFKDTWEQQIEKLFLHTKNYLLLVYRELMK